MVLNVLISAISYSQDIIIKRNGDEIKVKVSEITGSQIKYKRWENIDGPVYSLPKSEVFKVKYENGLFDFFGSANENPATSTSGSPAFPLLPLTNVPYFFEKSSNKIRALESVNFTKKKIPTPVGIITSIVAPGLSSTVRLHNNPSVTFLIKLNDIKTNPLELCELHRCETKSSKEDRVFKNKKAGAVGLIKQESVMLHFELISDGFYSISLPASLSPGEYFFQLIQQEKVFAFGYD
jgi:hypothetical protein